MHNAGFLSALPFEAERVGAAAIYCSDGRYNEQFDEFLHNHLHLPRYDRLVIPGGPAALAGHFSAFRDDDALTDQLRFLIESHHLTQVVLIAHRGCGYYLKKLMVGEHKLRRQQEEDLVKAAARINVISRLVEVSAFVADLTEQEADGTGGRVIIEPVEVGRR